jgi:phosphoglycolate phosphatase-like HAD superfamily hydrolase
LLPADAALVVGFDLDMTLVDSRAGIAYGLRGLAAETGRPIDVESIVARLGPPAEQALAPWFSVAEMPGALTRFRALMIAEGNRMCTPLPGAAAALAAVTAAGGGTLVVTGKYEPNAVDTLACAGLRADLVVGDLWAEDKAIALRAAGARIYVGDHPADVLAAHAADALAVGVPSGGPTREELVDAGADVVLDSLEQFPAWLSSV